MPKIKSKTLITFIKLTYDLAKNLEFLYYQVPYELNRWNKPVNIKKLEIKNKLIVRKIISQAGWLLQITSYYDFFSFDKNIYQNFIIPLRKQSLKLEKYLLGKNISLISNHQFMQLLSNTGNTIADFIYNFSPYQKNNLIQASRLAIKNISIQSKQSFLKKYYQLFKISLKSFKKYLGSYFKT